MTVKDRRVELGMTQKELADASGITPQFLCDIENSRSKPSLATAVNIAKALGVKSFKFLDDIATE